MKILKLVAILFLVLIVGFFFSNYNFESFKFVFSATMTSILMYLFLREYKSLFPYFISNMMNYKLPDFNKSVEKPRLLFYIIFGISACYILCTFNHIEGGVLINRIIAIIFILFITISICLLFYTWTEDFRLYFITSLQKLIIEQTKGFNIGWTPEKLGKIFDDLWDNDMIELTTKMSDVEKNEKELFIEMFDRNELPEYPIFKLLMDNIQTKYFYSSFSKNTTKFTLDDFLLFFENKNGRVTRTSVESSFSKSKKNPKKKEVIDQIFIF